jgi:hypothetical protein
MLRPGTAKLRPAPWTNGKPGGEADPFRHSQDAKSLYQNLNGQGRPISGRESDRPTPALKKPWAVVRGVNDAKSAARRGCHAARRLHWMLAGAIRANVRQPGNPAADTATIVIIAVPKTRAQIGLFVHAYDNVHKEEPDRRVLKKGE